MSVHCQVQRRYPSATSKTMVRLVRLIIHHENNPAVSHPSKNRWFSQHTSFTYFALIFCSRPEIELIYEHRVFVATRNRCIVRAPDHKVVYTGPRGAPCGPRGGRHRAHAGGGVGLRKVPVNVQGETVLLGPWRYDVIPAVWENVVSLGAPLTTVLLLKPDNNISKDSTQLDRRIGLSIIQKIMTQ